MLHPPLKKCIKWPTYSTCKPRFGGVFINSFSRVVTHLVIEYDLGLAEQLGSGMSRILKVYNKNIFKIYEHFIKVEFPFSVPLNLLSPNNGDINGDINRVLLLLEKQPSITAKQMAEALQISPRKVSRIIKELREKETIVRIGSNKTGYWKTQHK